MLEEGYDEDAIRNEVAVIRVQLAFVLQLTGDTNSMAQGILDDVLKAPYVHSLLHLLIPCDAMISVVEARPRPSKDATHSIILHFHIVVSSTNI